MNGVGKGMSRTAGKRVGQLCQRPVKLAGNCYDANAAKDAKVGASAERQHWCALHFANVADVAQKAKRIKLIVLICVIYYA